MDEALQLVIEMNERTWKRFKADLQDVTPEEIDWRPLPRQPNVPDIVTSRPSAHLICREQGTVGFPPCVMVWCELYR
jgi:hypothetical protein